MEIYTTASVNLNQFLNNMVMLTNFATALLKSGGFDKVGIFSSVLSPVFSFYLLAATSRSNLIGAAGETKKQSYCIRHNGPSNVRGTRNALAICS